MLAHTTQHVQQWSQKYVASQIKRVLTPLHPHSASSPPLPAHTPHESFATITLQLGFQMSAQHAFALQSALVHVTTTQLVQHIHPDEMLLQWWSTMLSGTSNVSPCEYHPASLLPASSRKSQNVVPPSEEPLQSLPNTQCRQASQCRWQHNRALQQWPIKALMRCMPPTLPAQQHHKHKAVVCPHNMTVNKHAHTPQHTQLSSTLHNNNPLTAKARSSC